MPVSTADCMILRISQERKVKGSAADFPSAADRSDACSGCVTAGQRRSDEGEHWHLPASQQAGKRQIRMWILFPCCRRWLQPGPAEPAHPGVHRGAGAAGSPVATSHPRPVTSPTLQGTRSRTTLG